MLKLVLVTLMVAGQQSFISTAEPQGCPDIWPHFHLESKDPQHMENRKENGNYMYDLDLADAAKGYIPGLTYLLGLRVNGDYDVMKGFTVLAAGLNPEEKSCGFGQFYSTNDGQVHEGCENVFVNADFKEKREAYFMWKAPDCGCVKIRATVMTAVDKFYTDDASKFMGPLTRTICPAPGHNPSEPVDIIDPVGPDFVVEPEYEDEDEVEEHIDEEDEHVDEEDSEEKDANVGHKKGHWKHKRPGKWQARKAERKMHKKAERKAARKEYRKSERKEEIKALKTEYKAQKQVLKAGKKEQMKELKTEKKEQKQALKPEEKDQKQAMKVEYKDQKQGLKAEYKDQKQGLKVDYKGQKQGLKADIKERKQGHKAEVQVDKENMKAQMKEAKKERKHDRKMNRRKKWQNQAGGLAPPVPGGFEKQQVGKPKPRGSRWQSFEDKVAFVCLKLQNPPLRRRFMFLRREGPVNPNNQWQGHVKQVLDCCTNEKEGRIQCFRKLKQEKIDGFCDSGAALIPWKRTPAWKENLLKTHCCGLAGEARVDCFIDSHYKTPGEKDVVATEIEQDDADILEELEEQTNMWAEEVGATEVVDKELEEDFFEEEEEGQDVFEDEEEDEDVSEEDDEDDDDESSSEEDSPVWVGRKHKKGRWHGGKHGKHGKKGWWRKQKAEMGPRWDSFEDKVEFICLKVKNPRHQKQRQLSAHQKKWQEHKEKMLKCCDQEKEGRMSCFLELKQEKINGFCSGEVEFGPHGRKMAMWKQKYLKENCCTKEGEERLDCFEHRKDDDDSESEEAVADIFEDDREHLEDEDEDMDEDESNYDDDTEEDDDDTDDEDDDDFEEEEEEEFGFDDIDEEDEDEEDDDIEDEDEDEDFEEDEGDHDDEIDGGFLADKDEDSQGDAPTTDNDEDEGWGRRQGGRWRPGKHGGRGHHGRKGHHRGHHRIPQNGPVPFATRVQMVCHKLTLPSVKRHMHIKAASMGHRAPARMAKVKQALQCCMQAGVEAQVDCFLKSKQERINRFCDTKQPFQLWKNVPRWKVDYRHTRCCPLEGEARMQCFDKPITPGENGAAQLGQTSGELLKQCCDAGRDFSADITGHRWHKCNKEAAVYVRQEGIRQKAWQCMGFYKRCCAHPDVTPQGLSTPAPPAYEVLIPEETHAEEEWAGQEELDNSINQIMFMQDERE